MLANLNHPTHWDPQKLISWIKGLSDEEIFATKLSKINELNGRKLFLLTALDLQDLLIDDVDTQEMILYFIDQLRQKILNYQSETIQSSVLELSCQSRTLQQKLSSQNKGGSSIISTFDTHRVSIETLTSVTDIVSIVDDITSKLNRYPFSAQSYYKSMKSLFSALGIELASTAQRDQFVEKPNDVIEKCVKSLADYCDRILNGKIDSMLVEPYTLELVNVRHKINLPVESNCGIHLITKKVSYRSSTSGCETSILNVGDEIVQINGQIVIGWTKRKFEQLLENCSNLNLIVRKPPSM